MTEVTYENFLKNRTLLSKHVDHSFNFGGFALFKNLEEAKKQCKNPNLFIVSLVITQWSETDCYPQLYDGEKENAFGYYVAYGKNNNEYCLFKDCPLF